MPIELNLPTCMPVMTLPDTVFFPRALLPLYIFEERYRKMLTDVLGHHRIFAVAGLNRQQEEEGLFEPPHPIATAGIIRACQKNDDGNSQLLLQGLCRIEFKEIVAEEPYRRALVQPLTSLSQESDAKLADLSNSLSRLIRLREDLGLPVPPGANELLQTISEPEALVDLAAFALCEDSRTKQELLETLDTGRRIRQLATVMRREIDAARIHRDLQGNLPDEDIANN